MSASRIQFTSPRKHHLIQSSDGLMGMPARPEAKGAVQKVLLVDGLQHVTHGALDDLVLKRRNPTRSCPTSVFGDVHPTDRLMPIPLGPQPGVQVLKILLQVLPILVLGDPIHPDCRILSAYSSRRPPAPAHPGDAPVNGTRPSGSLRARSTTFRIAGDMSPDVNAPVMCPFESSHQHGPPLLGRVRGPTRSPTSSLVCSPPTPSLPSAEAPVVPGRWPTLSLVRHGGRRASQVPGPSSSSVP